MHKEVQMDGGVPVGTVRICCLTWDLPSCPFLQDCFTGLCSRQSGGLGTVGIWTVFW